MCGRRLRVNRPIASFIPNSPRSTCSVSSVARVTARIGARQLRMEAVGSSLEASRATRKASPRRHLIVSQGDAKSGGACKPRCAVLVENVDFLDREARAGDELDYRTGEVASAEQPLLDRIEASLPATHGLVRRQAVLYKMQARSGLEHAPQLAQGGSDIRDGAQRPRGQGSVKALIRER